jgi:plastocyanin
MTAPMHQGRAGDIAITLNNGLVLVTGGLGNTGPVPSSELYNATSNTWTMTGSMSVARFDQQMVLLNDGRVLSVGGDTGSAVNNATEIYNPATRTWSTVAPQPMARSDMIAIKLPNGNVLVAGGHTANSTTALSAIYNPTTNTWTQTGPLLSPTGDAQGVLLKNREVLIAGGYTFQGSDNSNQYLYLSEVFNTTTNSWAMTGDMNYPRGEGSINIDLLNNGEVLYPGGNYQPETAETSADLYNPAAGTWSLAGTMATPHGEGVSSVVLSNGKALVIGGLIPHACTYCGVNVTSAVPALGRGQDLATTGADLYTPPASTSGSSGSGPIGFRVKMTGAGESQTGNYQPASITVVIGVNSTVTWVNDDSVPHTVTSKTVPTGASSFNSGNMDPGATFTYTFSIAGTYSYYCQYHGWMQATVIVLS